MRVSFVLPGLTLGGAERMVVELVRAVRDEGWSVQVLATTRGGPLARPLADAGAHVRVLGLDPSTPWRLRRALTGFGSQVLHSHLAVADIVSLGAPRRIAWLTTVHNPGVELGTVRRRLWPWALRRTRLRTFVSRAVAEATPSPPGRVIHPSFVDPDRLPRPSPELRVRIRRQLGLADDAPLLVAAGRRTWIKGPDVLARAAELLGRPVVQFGSGAPLPDSAWVRWQPPTDDLWSVFAAADAFIQSSRSEGFPQATLEAMWCGCPVVATRVGGTEELVGRHGLLVPPDAPKELARGVREMLQRPDQARSTARAAREGLRERNLTRAAMTRTFLDLYRSMADR
jgi:glycosyltransferase involved in cell wall biosynthesis